MNTIATNSLSTLLRGKNPLAIQLLAVDQITVAPVSETDF